MDEIYETIINAHNLLKEQEKKSKDSDLLPLTYKPKDASIVPIISHQVKASSSPSADFSNRPKKTPTMDFGIPMKKDRKYSSKKSDRKQHRHNKSSSAKHERSKDFHQFPVSSNLTIQSDIAPKYSPNSRSSITKTSPIDQSFGVFNRQPSSSLIDQIDDSSDEELPVSIAPRNQEDPRGCNSVDKAENHTGQKQEGTKIDPDIEDELYQDMKYWIELDDDIKLANEVLKTIKNKKKELTTKLLGSMDAYQITDMSIGDNKIIYETTSRKETLKKDNIRQKLLDYLNDPDMADELSEYIENSRGKNFSHKLKRKVPGGKKNSVSTTKPAPVVDISQVMSKYTF